MSAQPEKPLFNPGDLYIMPGAQQGLTEEGRSPLEFFRRHIRGDWGDMAEEDKELNNRALVDGSRIFSAYQVSEVMRLWVITEAMNDAGVREYTTELLPSEYKRPAVFDRVEEAQYFNYQRPIWN